MPARPTPPPTEAKAALAGAADGAIGVFGGTFDPVHLAHLRLAEEAADRLGLAGVRWIPAGQPRHRATPAVDAAERLAMVQLAIAGNARFSLDGSEAASATPSYTVPTLERLRADGALGRQRPLVLLVGADAFAGLPGWHEWRRIFALAHVAVAHRPGFPVDPERLPAELAAIFHSRYQAEPESLGAAPAGTIVSFAMTQLDVSATQIRALLAAGRSVRYLLPEAVIEHIRNKNLYRRS